MKRPIHGLVWLYPLYHGITPVGRLTHQGYQPVTLQWPCFGKSSQLGPFLNLSKRFFLWLKQWGPRRKTSAAASSNSVQSKVPATAESFQVPQNCTETNSSQFSVSVSQFRASSHRANETPMVLPSSPSSRWEFSPQPQGRAGAPNRHQRKAEGRLQIASFLQQETMVLELRTVVRSRESEIEVVYQRKIWFQQRTLDESAL